MLTLDVPADDTVSIVVKYVGMLCAVLGSIKLEVDSLCAYDGLRLTSAVSAGGHHGSACIVDDSLDLGASHEADMLATCCIAGGLGAGCWLPCIRLARVGCLPFGE